MSGSLHAVTGDPVLHYGHCLLTQNHLNEAIFCITWFVFALLLFVTLLNLAIGLFFLLSSGPRRWFLQWHLNPPACVSYLIIICTCNMYQLTCALYLDCHGQGDERSNIWRLLLHVAINVQSGPSDIPCLHSEM
jgi:hypothetical protein